MPVDSVRLRTLLAAFDFSSLFVEELGWSRHEARLDIQVDGQAFTLSAVAEKCGMAVFICNSGDGERIPDDQTRRKIERQVTKSAYEHLIVFLDAAKSQQYWLWSRRETGSQPVLRGEWYRRGETGERLAQKIRHLAVALEEEENLTLPDVTGRARKAFDVEHVTKKFYDRFKAEHAAFLKFLEGIPDGEMERWYVSVMLNRLMFIYFIQKKGFLGGDADYLKNKLVQSRRELGKDRYYRDFLCPLFFEGFAKQKGERTEKARKLLGEVPYLNGGIFMPHQIEHLHGRTIAVPDKAFEKLFEFFDAYHWHLDERPLRADNEINPDVLGYIFEKYINQKQMGAYYTKEDITGYISQNTVIPFLFDAAREKCKVAFEGERPVWRLLAEDSDRYIYPAVEHGADKPLPPEIADGLDTARPNLLERRKPWNKPAPPEYALPTEIWREVVVRRKRYEEVKGKLAEGEIRTINDLITYNLDIRRFAQDAIENAEGPELLVAFWKAIEAVTVLDPTCGSGAFLFAALNILDPLCEACLERMRFFLEEWGEGGKKNHPNYYKLFTEILKRVEDHPNRRYFVLKSVIVNNLFGVDIMEEAVEICKLRLFLKLVAQIERAEDVEPLPDIDFNIRAGNTLVGFASLGEVKKTQEGTLGFGKSEVARIEEEAEIADRAFCKFREMQTLQGMSPVQFAEAKEELRSRLKKLTDELDLFQAGEYGINESKIPNKRKREEAFTKWRKSHQPFHWFAEFYGILKSGGFDVIVGNPPYVEKKSVHVQYSILNYCTESTNNLFAYASERSRLLLGPSGRFGFILLLSAMSTDKFEPLQSLVLQQNPVWVSHFDDRPSRLFENLEHCQQTIVLYLVPENTTDKSVHVTRCYKWNAAERSHLLNLIEYVRTKPGYMKGSLQKISSAIEASIFEKLWRFATPLSHHTLDNGPHVVFYTRKVHAFLNILDFVPEIRDGKGKRRDPSEQKTVEFGNKASAAVALCALNSTLFRWYLTAFSDCRNVNRREVLSFPVDLQRLVERHGEELGKLAKRISASLKSTSEVREMRFGGETLTVQCIIPKHSKPIIDEIDKVLARHYGFTDEELDFIINYDIKYRMGQEAGSEKEQNDNGGASQ
jgi:hypothetical protein